MMTTESLTIGTAVTPSASRIAIVLSATLVLGACQDAGDPLAPSLTTTSSTAPVSSMAPTASASALAAIGADLVDATGMFLVVVEDAQTRTDLTAAIQALADELNAGDAAGAGSALTTARQRLAAVAGDATATELAPVAIALGRVEQVLRGTP